MCVNYYFSSLVRSGGEQSAGLPSCRDYITKRRYDAISCFSYFVITTFFFNIAVRNGIHYLFCLQMLPEIEGPKESPPRRSCLTAVCA